MTNKMASDICIQRNSDENNTIYIYIYKPTFLLLIPRLHRRLLTGPERRQRTIKGRERKLLAPRWNRPRASRPRHVAPAAQVQKNETNVWNKYIGQIQTIALFMPASHCVCKILLSCYASKNVFKFFRSVVLRPIPFHCFRVHFRIRKSF